MSTINAEHTRALTMLAGCPDGATDYALTSLHKFTPRVLFDLIESKLASAGWHTVGTSSRRFSVMRMHITNAGRQAIE